MRDEEPDDGRLSRPVLREPEGRNSPRATRHVEVDGGEIVLENEVVRGIRKF